MNDYKDMTVAFDVDGTLITNGDDADGNPIPRPNVMWLYRYFKSAGCDMIIWSSGGNDWATKINNYFNLGARIITKWSMIPDIAVDDDRAIDGIGYGKRHICVGWNPTDMTSINDDF